MKINIKATNISLTPSIRQYVNKKLNLLRKFYKEGEEVIVDVEVGRITKHHKSGDIFKAEIRINSRGNEYYANVNAEDLYAAIDEVKDEITRELTSKRKKTLRLFRKGGARIKYLLKGLADIGDKGWRKFRGEK